MNYFKNVLIKEVFNIRNLTDPFIILILISMSNFFIMSILDKDIKRNNIKDTVYNLITIIVTFPAIPLIWAVFYDLGSKSNSFVSFYIPLIITILMVSALIIRIVKYKKMNIN